MLNIVKEFEQAMAAKGIVCLEPIITDNTLHRFYIKGDKQNSKNGWYILFDNNGITVGLFGSWKTGGKFDWCSHATDKLSSVEKAAYQQQLVQAKAKSEETLQQLRTAARLRAKELFEAGQFADENYHYLQKKGIKVYGLRLKADNSALMIPLHDSQGTIHSLQFIKPDGKKLFLRDGTIQGHYFKIGETTETIYLCEGYATGATIFAATGKLVIVAFNAGNLLPVAQAIRYQYPSSRLIICADNDQYNANGNVGVAKATAAARAVNGEIVTPIFKDVTTKPTDFNDLLVLEGLEAVQQQLAKPELLVQGEELSVTAYEESNEKQSQASLLLASLKNIELFHDEQKHAYASFNVEGHTETWAIDSEHFKQWLAHHFWQIHHKALNRNALQDVISTLSGKALFEGKCYPVFYRVGLAANAIYWHLGNENWDVVEIDATGWRLIENSPVKFKGQTSTKALPTPIRGGDINLLWQHINIPEEARKLVIAWLIECLRPNTHFPLLVLTGQQGCAKSSTQHILRNLIDPNACNLRGAPRKADDITIAAANNWLVSYNNLSNLTPQQQDDLCCLATGGGFASRRLYTGTEEELINIKRPVIINGINDLVTAQDLIDRCVVIELPVIASGNRKSDQQLQAAFEKDYPLIVGVLLDALSAALRYLPETSLSEMPRMADFALLGTALEKVFGWTEGSFLAAYEKNRRQSIAQAMEYSPVAVALAQFIEKEHCYYGSYSTLYKLLTGEYRPEISGWPKSPKGLASILKRQAPALKQIGIDIQFESSRKKDGFYLKITHTDNSDKHVHQVHQVQHSSPKHAYSGEHLNADVHLKHIIPQHVHHDSPYPGKGNELTEHGEHYSTSYSSDTRERIIV